MANAFDDMIEQKLLNLHTAFIGKVTSVSGDFASVQPLNLIKAVGGKPKKQALLENIPVSRSCKQFTTETVILTSGDKLTLPKVSGVQTGNTVICLCADRDITDTRKGNFALPSLGHHSITDAVVVGII